GEKPAPGSTISGPDLVTPEVPACTAPAVEVPPGSAPETWILHPVTASSTTASDAAAERALRRNMTGSSYRGPRTVAWSPSQLPSPGKVASNDMAVIRGWPGPAGPQPACMCGRLGHRGAAHGQH